MMSRETSVLVEPALQAWWSRLPDQFCLEGTGSKAHFLGKSSAPKVRLPRLPAVFEHEPDDQVAVVYAGATIAEVQSELAKRGQGLPIPTSGSAIVDGFGGTVGGMLAMALPNGLTSIVGPPRNWVLGLLTVLHDGTLAKSGSRAVKSVAGYDVHKLYIGSRGTLGPIVAAAVRVYPLPLPKPTITLNHEWTGGDVWIQRVLKVDFEAALAASTNPYAFDRESHTIWHSHMPERRDHDWIICPNGEFACDGAPRHLIDRAKIQFDPQGRFNPGIAI